MNFFRKNKFRRGDRPSGDDGESLPFMHTPQQFGREGAAASDADKAGTTYSYQSTAGLSMDDGDDSTTAGTPSQQYMYLSSTTTYIILATLFTGFCLGFSVAFWFASSYYWQSEAGLQRLGCVGETSNTNVNADGRREHNMNISTSNVEKLVGGGFAGSLRAEDGYAAVHDQIFQADEPWIQDLLGPTDDEDDIPLSQLLGSTSLLEDLEVLGKGSSTSTSSTTTTTTTARPNVYMNHIEAYEMLLDDDKKTGGLLGSSASIGPFASHYFLLNTGLDVQVNQAYCAAAASAAVLNSLRFMHPRTEVGVDIPTDAIYSPYSYATQMDLFGECTTKNVVAKAGSNTFGGWGSDGILTFPYGMNLEQTAELLRCHLNATAGWTVTTQHLDDTHLTLSKMRFDMKVALTDPSSRLIVNYHRAAAGQVGSGHFSPVGAYHQGTDSFLILDVARYKYPPVWIAAEILWKALRTYDQCGDWDFPHAQEGLDDRLRAARTDDEVKEAMDVLGCKRALRGYIIAKRS